MNPTARPRSRPRPSSAGASRGAPQSATEPDVGRSRPAARPRSVVLPLPLGPTMAHVAPSARSNETSSRTVRRRLPLSKVLVRRRTERASVTVLRFGGGVLVRPAPHPVATGIREACADLREASADRGTALCTCGLPAIATQHLPPMLRLRSAGLMLLLATLPACSSDSAESEPGAERSAESAAPAG